MTMFTFRGLLVQLGSAQHAAFCWMPSAIITDPVTGESAPVCLPRHESTQDDANDVAAREARRRIAAGTWRN